MLEELLVELSAANITATMARTRMVAVKKRILIWRGGKGDKLEGRREG